MEENSQVKYGASFNCEENGIDVDDCRNGRDKSSECHYYCPADQIFECQKIKHQDRNCFEDCYYCEQAKLREEGT